MPLKDADATADADRQLPQGDEIFLDHVGHFVVDADAACRALGRAGFAPTPKSIQFAPPADGAPAQPTGTGNITAMLRRGYIEVLFKTADTPLGREFERSLAAYTGLHLIAFSVADAVMAHTRLQRSGFRVRPLVHLTRPVETEDGQGRATFTVARVEPGEMAEGRVQILTHRTEDIVWQPRWLAHPNTAIGVSDVVIVSADTAEAARRFARFTARASAPMDGASSGGAAIVPLDRGRVVVMTTDHFAQLVPNVPCPTLPFIAGYGVVVRSIEAVAALLGDAGLPARTFGRALIAAFAPELGLGAWFFVENPRDLPWR